MIQRNKAMKNQAIQFVFFANYFVGLLAVALSVETAFQLSLPLCSPVYYSLLFFATVMYYTYAYTSPASLRTSPNPRTEWYRSHDLFIQKSQWILMLLSLTALGWLLSRYYSEIVRLPLHLILLVSTLPLSGLLYYGLLPHSIFRFNLRNTGWLKAFVIGYTWAVCVNVLPVTTVRIEQGVFIHEPGLMLWLFLKNWMFCTVNAIMFDLKDYAEDSNRQLKTFVVRLGLRKTIFYILIPLLLIGFFSFLAFAYFRNFGTVPILFNAIPFLCLLTVAYSLQKRKPIIYYLIVIDGLLLIKALCGIAGALF